MNEVYKVSGMTCDGCANSIKEALELNNLISSVNISLENENINISSDKSFTVNELNSLIENLGNYKIYAEKFTSKIETCKILDSKIIYDSNEINTLTVHDVFKQLNF